MVREIRHCCHISTATENSVPIFDLQVAKLACLSRFFLFLDAFVCVAGDKLGFS